MNIYNFNSQIKNNNKQQQKQKKYIIGSISQNGEWNISKNPFIHTSLISAKQEAARLALLFTDKHFIILDYLETAYSSKIIMFK